ncbi:fimbria/pilus periplasmic chaperone [Salmonella enterica subsp. enterica serovar Altona]|nr:fimbria/pilus periplasmic chaperone [Salmonella enterica subsp. enterica serovar Altona]
MLKVFCILSISAFSVFGYSSELQPKVNMNKFETILGGTRLVYNLEGNGETISIKNPQQYPMLVQSQIKNEDGSISNEFIVKPPLFRLDALRQTDLTIKNISGTFNQSQESLKFLCVKGIPPKKTDAWNDREENKDMDMSINLSINTCIKMIIKPKELDGAPSEYVDKISWSYYNGKLIAKNNSPYIIQPNKLLLNGKSVASNGYIMPFNKKEYKVSGFDSSKKTLQWSLINEDGAESKLITVDLK